MNKTLPVFVILAVILFGAAGVLYINKSTNTDVMAIFGKKKVVSVPTEAPKMATDGGENDV
jgi:CRISPR/Cas system-associated protein Csm6